MPAIRVRVVCSVLFALLARPPQAQSEGVRPELLEAARAAASAHAGMVKNRSIIAVIDYGLPSKRPRLFLIDPQSGQTESYLVAHGRGSDPDFDGIATRFSNEADSKTSSLGAYVTGTPYFGAHGLSLKLVGLDPTNSRAEARAIVLHGADYVAQDRTVLGRSWGCPAVEMRHVRRLIERLKGGALLFVGR